MSAPPSPRVATASASEPRHALRRRLAVLCALLWVLALSTLSVPTTALAQDVPRLAAQVTDLTQGQVLSGGRDRIDAAIAELRASHNLQLFVLFVDSTGRQTVTEYAEAVARRGSLGGNDVLLVVAVGDRSDALWRSAQMADRLTDRELATILSDRVEPLLAQGDYAGAVAAGASGLADAAAGTLQSGQPSGDLGLSLGPLLFVALLVIAGLWLWSAYASHRRQRQAAEERARQLEQLAQEANSLLIQADDALGDAKEDIGFAEAQFGVADVAPYRAAVTAARDDLRAAFALRQQLDDATPETPEERRRIVEQIVVLSKQALAQLTEQQQRIEQLREVERRAPEILTALPAQLAAAEARIPQVARTLDGLQRYAEQNWSSVATNVEQARALLADAREAVAEGERALGAGERPEAGRCARAGQQRLASATQLLDAVESLGQSLRQAEEAAAAQVAEAASDITAARAALDRTDALTLRRRLDEAESALAQAKQELSAAKPDVLTASRLATQASTLTDQILDALRQEEERRARQARHLAAQLQTAEASYTRAAHYMTARRRGLGWAARTRLAEARRHLDEALARADIDPPGALAEARRAQALAEEALALAQQDFGALGPYGPLGGGTFPVPFPIPTGHGGWGGGRGGSGGGGGAIGGRW